MTDTGYPEFTETFNTEAELPFFGFCFPGEHAAGSGFLVFIPLNSDLADYPPEADGLDIDYIKLQAPLVLDEAV